MDMGSDLMNPSQEPSRRAYMLRKFILKLQESFLVIEKCPQPVIAAVHSGCVGGGVDMVCNCDIRLCSEDAWFQVKVCLSWLSSFALSWLNVALLILCFGMFQIGITDPRSLGHGPGGISVNLWVGM